MKFIKDIIGEKRERVRAEAAGHPAAEPVQPPARDPFDSLAAAPEAEQPSVPFSLDRGFQLDPEPETAAEDYVLPEDFLEEDSPEGARQDGPQDSAEEYLDSLGEPGPEDDAIAAFFAREQAQDAALDPGSAAAAQEYAESDDPFAAASEVEAYMEAEDGEELDAFAEEPDFSRLQQQEPAAEQPESYRVFHRKSASAPQPEVQPEPELLPEPAPQPQYGMDAPAPAPAEAQPAPVPQMQSAPPPAAEAPQKTAPAPQAAEPQDPHAAAAPIDVPAPSMGRGASRAGRVKTRLLGFSPAQAPGSDPFARSTEEAAPGYTQFPVGWLAVVQGPGRGAAFTLFSGVTVIGRGEDQTVRLDFGDNSISRDNHAAIAYDAEQKAFYIGHGGKANLVRRNSRPVLSTEELAAGDEIRIGETTLRFVPLCGASFGWDQPQQGEGSNAAFR
ncbi:FHA domain-containing protein [Leisingera sp. ANG-DT]|uniref:FHA domain-containing protein n=1 Tax=Leisingera sp. ANG-DT TaxID=1577897 RepID=UPI000689B0B9|nr:FHA domain-containing protein [Leisingera sp. ANG-DT]